MPGERLEDALAAAGQLQKAGAGILLTRLGENVNEAGEALAVTRHYLDVFERVAAAGLDAQISIKLTQLGLDLDASLCQRNLIALVEAAERSQNFVWIDMESSAYVDRTIALYRQARAISRRVGVCLQAYLYRTADEVEALLPLGPAVRIVKGAYKEPASVAFPRKRDVDENFFALATRLLRDDARAAESFLGVATHDRRLIARIEAHVKRERIPTSAFEVEMLYGIQRPLQQRLAREGRPLRVLIAYGEYWFAWYMRRLAERPANVLFVLKNLFAR